MQSNLRKRVNAVQNFFYDKENDTYCRKTATSWKNVLVIYSVYFWGVMLTFAIGLYIINSQAMKHGVSRQFDKRDLIADNTPQLTFVPKLPYSRLLWFTDEVNNSNILTADYYIKYLDKYLKKYENPDPSIYVDCSNPNVITKGKFCIFTKQMLGPCGRDGYGYREGKPCIFLKLNNMRGWDPWSKVEKEIAESEGVIEGEEEEFSAQERRNETLTTECTPGTSQGCERLGYISHYPSNNFPSYFFPYNGSDKYLAPLVAVQFADSLRGMVFKVTCRVWGIPMTKAVREMLSQDLYLYINEGEEQRK